MRLLAQIGLYRFLERPRFYNAIQRLFLVGGDQEIRNLFRNVIDARRYDSVLELGCGTGAWPITQYRRFVRTDINDDYFPSVSERGVEYRTVDATDLSAFPDQSFDLVYSMGLYHHLPDAAVVASLKESARVIRPGGRIVVFDAILPTRPWRVPAWIVRKADRGHWVRADGRMTTLLDQAGLIVQCQTRCQWSLVKLEGCCWEVCPLGHSGGSG
jgi:SAM-dependent methyltransferase